MRIEFQNLGWASRVCQKRATLSISISKLVTVGCGLQKGQKVYSYLGKDASGRPLMVTYLDGAQKGKSNVLMLREADTPLLCDIIE